MGRRQCLSWQGSRPTDCPSDSRSSASMETRQRCCDSLMPMKRRRIGADVAHNERRRVDGNETFLGAPPMIPIGRGLVQRVATLASDQRAAARLREALSRINVWRTGSSVGASLTRGGQKRLGMAGTLLGGLGIATAFGGTADKLPVSAAEGPAASDSGSQSQTSQGPSGTSATEMVEWRGDLTAQRYSPLSQINRENVGKLAIVWRRPGLDPSFSGAAPVGFTTPANDFKSSPLMIDGVLYAPNAIGLVEAFDPATGKTLWLQEPYRDEPDGGLRGMVSRTVAYWSEGSTRRLFVVRGEYLVALDPATGRPVRAWGDNGRVFLRPGLGPRARTFANSSGPQICRDVVIVGSQQADAETLRKEQAPGNVQAFDVRTGKPRWVFKVIPEPGHFGNETWENGSWEY